MRSIWPGLLTLLVVPILAAAGPPQAPPAQPQPQPEQMLDGTLLNWEKAMTKLDRFEVTVRRTTADKTFGSIETYEGSAKFLKSAQGQPSRAILEIVNKKDPSKYEKFLYTGTFLYEWVPATKVLRIHDVPQAKAGQPGIEDNIVALLFGMKADDAKRRYQMSWRPDAENKNKYYHYVQIIPRTPADKSDFTEARLVLTSSDFLPRQVWYHQPNGNEVTWDFEKLKKNQEATISAQTFAPPQALPKDWRVERVQIGAGTTPGTGAAPGTGVAPKK
jgi:TIGR03009 family protein